MRRFRAFLTALALFLATVAAGHFLTRGHVADDPSGYALWCDEDKSRSYAGLTENMTDQMIPVFASSELQHGRETIYHPSRLFADSDFRPMLIGAGYYQSLGHAVTLAAIEDSMTVRKAVLILSPQWFRKTGVVGQAYTSRFSQVLYQHMLKNEKLDNDLKIYISDRTHKLLKTDQQTLARVRLDEKALWEKDTEGLEGISQALWEQFLKEKDMYSIIVHRKTDLLADKLTSPGNLQKTPMRDITLPETAAAGNGDSGTPEMTRTAEPDWEALLTLAEEDGKKNNTNDFYIKDEAYKRLKPYLPLKKDMNADAEKGYQTGPEFDDLECFLKVCSQTGITPMLVMLPVNGYYYDFTAFPQSARQAYYKKIRGIASEYGAVLADYSGEEYTRYFFEDRVHLGQKGWVMVSEKIYQFYKGETSAD